MTIARSQAGKLVAGVLFAWAVRRIVVAVQRSRRRREVLREGRSRAASLRENPRAAPASAALS